MDGCDNPSRARGLCVKHYRIWHREHNPDYYAQRAEDNRTKYRHYTRSHEPDFPALLRKARECYNNACGVEARLRWKRTVQRLEKEVQGVLPQL